MTAQPMEDGDVNDPNRSSSRSVFAIGRQGIFRQDRAHHSAFMPADLIAFAHFSVSSAVSSPKSLGDPQSPFRPGRLAVPFILETVRAALISRLSLSMISAGASWARRRRPVTRLVAREEIGHGWNVRHRYRARCCGHCQCARRADSQSRNGSRTMVAWQRRHNSADLHPAVEIDRILIGYADAARGNRLSDVFGLVGAMDAVQRVLATRVEVQGA